MQILMRKYGPAAIGRYWHLVELCAEKLDKGAAELFDESHCVFEFERSYLMRSLGYVSIKQTSCYLQALTELGLCSAHEIGEVFSCSMPKLLECLDRDAKRARTDRVPSAPKKKRKNKKEEIEIKGEFSFQEAFDQLAKTYRSLFPGATTGGKARDRFMVQCTDPKVLKDLEDSMAHYRLALNAQPWRAAKTTFETYLGTGSSGYFWRDYIEMPELPPAPKSNSLDDLDLTEKEGA